MILRKIRPLRPGTARYSIGGVPGLDDDDRAVASIWPGSMGTSCVLLVTVSGSINDRRTTTIHDAGRPDRVATEELKQHVARLLAQITRRHTATGVDNGLH